MKIVEMKKNFKSKDGYFRTVMYEKYGDWIKVQHSLCYPAVQKGKYVEYVQNTYDVKRDVANKEWAKLKKQGYTSAVIE